MNLQLYKTEYLKYIKEIFGIKYGINNYNVKAKCNAKDEIIGKLEDI